MKLAGLAAAHGSAHAVLYPVEAVRSSESSHGMDVMARRRGFWEFCAVMCRVFPIIQCLSRLAGISVYVPYDSDM